MNIMYNASVIILKVFVYSLILSIGASVFAVIPFYSHLNTMAMDIVMRASMNNYITLKEVDSIIYKNYSSDGESSVYDRAGFNETGAWYSSSGAYKNVNMYDALTYKEDDETINVYLTGGLGEMNSFGAFDFSPARSIGTDHQVLLNRDPVTFDPKTKESDREYLKARGVNNRGGTVTARVETQMNFIVMAPFQMFEVPLPLSVTKSAPAMYYYRNME